MVVFVRSLVSMTIPTRSLSKSANKILYKTSLYSEKTPNVLICTGPAGTGKTLEACKAGLEFLQDQKVERLIITRPNVTVDESMGFLPGDMQEKMYPWMIPIYEYLEKFSDKKTITRYLRDGFIEVCPLGYMRGRTFHDTFVIADEMQNSTPRQMMNLLTRIGENSKLVVTGDLNQCDLYQDNGLSDFVKKLKSYDNEQEFICHIALDDSDVMRSEVVKEILNIYKM